MDRTFDRVPSFDERSRAFPIRALLADTGPLQSRAWSCPIVLDQGSEGACVGFGWSHELAARPVEVRRIDDEFAFALYRDARRIDEWPGEDYDGTSVLAGAKVVKALGAVDEYRWAFGLEDVLRTLAFHGPVVLGVSWREGMFTPDARHHVHATGDVVGGHCILARTISVTYRTVRLHNSWGRGWGDQGTALISWDDLGRLLGEDGGEACVPVRRSQPESRP